MATETIANEVAAPQLIQPAFEEMLTPLVEELSRGLSSGVFYDIDPVSEAQSIQGVVWARTERHWAAGDRARAEVRSRTLRFCLRGLGVKAATIDEIAARDRL